jgi:hypothetical protein
MPSDGQNEVELEPLHPMEEETEAGRRFSDSGLEEDDPLSTQSAYSEFNDAVDRRTKRKLDFLLLPFLAVLFLLNSLDKSNVGNAETVSLSNMNLEQR